MSCDAFTIKSYLSGKVRDITIPDNAARAICADAGVNPETLYSDCTKKQRDLALAYTYVWLAGPVLSTGTVRDSDADWEHSEGGTRLSATLLNKYLDMANAIFESYDMPSVGEGDWGFVGRGFPYPTNMRNTK